MKNNQQSNDFAALPKGICDHRSLPAEDFDLTWESIIVDDALKSRLLCQAILNFNVRPRFARARLPLHGVIVLTGPPGTGKTSLGRGLASRTAASLKMSKPFTYLEVEPHALASASLGKSQQAVLQLLGSVIPEYAEHGPLIVLLDEVETLAADRAKLSLDANPVDVHRATDAVLAQLDQLAERHPNLLFVATSNYEQAIDRAFLSRADLVVSVALPNMKACEAILRDTIGVLAEEFEALKNKFKDSDYRKAAELAVGLDGRRIRKVVFSALTLDKSTALSPEKLSAADLLKAIEMAKKEVK